MVYVLVIENINILVIFLEKPSEVPSIVSCLVHLTEGSKGIFNPH